jgi:hypothetical protein
VYRKIVVISIFISILITSIIPADPALAAGVETAGDLTVHGVVESTSGGFKFPDGTTWTAGSMSGLNFNVGFVVDNSGSNTGNMNNGAIKFGSSSSGEGIASQRTSGDGQNGLDFYTSSTARLSIASNGDVGIGTRTPAAKLNVVSDDTIQAQFGPTPIYLESLGSATEIGFNLHWDGGNSRYVYGSSYAGATILNSVSGLLFGVAPTGTVGGSPPGNYPKFTMLMTPSGKVRIGDNTAPSETLDVAGNIKSSGNVTAANIAATGALSGSNGSIAGSLAVDNGNANNGAISAAALTFGSSSGEGIASKRTAYGNQNGLDFYTGSTRRMSISQTGMVAIGADPRTDTALYVNGDGNTYNGIYITNPYANGYGLRVEANNGPNAWAIFGGSTTGFAGFFMGKVAVTGNLNVGGTLTKGGGSFRIDHPLDPANKYLSHSFVESPDMKNIYDGIAVLDGNGEAVVDLPDWFQALNRDFRYQLTAIGAPGPDLYIAQEVNNNSFRIAGGKANGKVSWQVTGIRQDAWANAHRIPVEENKAAAEAGTYIHPELFGQPETKGVRHLLKK